MGVLSGQDIVKSADQKPAVSLQMPGGAVVLLKWPYGAFCLFSAGKLGWPLSSKGLCEGLHKVYGLCEA